MMTEQASEDRSEAEQKADPLVNPAGWLEQHGDALYRFARAKVGQREVAEDLVQETLLGALQSLDQFRGNSQPRTWLLAILRRKIADHYRRHRADSPDVEADDLRADKDRSPSRYFDEDGHWLKATARWKLPADSLENDEFWIAIHDCLAHLPRHLARAFLLRELEGYEVDHLRQVLDIGAENLRVRLHRARLILRGCLEKNWFETDSDPDRSQRLT